MKLKTIISAALAAILACACAPKSVKPQVVDSLPEIWPDYVGVTVPVGIAPLNFGMAEPRKWLALQVWAGGISGEPIHVSGKDHVEFPEEEWHALLKANRGGSVKVIVCAKDLTGWKKFREFELAVSEDRIDSHLCYRLLPPSYVNYGKMGIYQRELDSFKESTVLDNSQWTGCVNCHSFRKNDPSEFSLHIRGEHGATLLRLKDGMEAWNTRTDSTSGFCVYPYWHPGGRYIAYSTNNTRQVFHTGGKKMVEVYDSASDVQVLDLQTMELILPDATRSTADWESFPAFSADGRGLFFVSARGCGNGETGIREVRYDLCCTSFDPQTGAVGSDVTVLFDASSSGKSVSMPRPSPDGKFLLMTIADYGSFGIWHPEADLILLDLRNGMVNRMQNVNSPDAESYHSWSSNGRWIVFGSRRDDHCTTRAYMAHVNSNGRCGKAFLLPQKDPRKYYLEQICSYNVPEFVTGPVQLDAAEAVRKIKSEERKDFKYTKR